MLCRRPIPPAIDCGIKISPDEVFDVGRTIENVHLSRAVSLTSVAQATLLSAQYNYEVSVYEYVLFLADRTATHTHTGA